MANTRGIVIGAAVVALLAAGITWGLVAGPLRPQQTDATEERVYSDPDQQRERVRTPAIPEAVAELSASGFTPATAGKLTVAISPFTPPLGYVSENGATVGSEPDTAQLIADGLGLTLNLVVVSWADWPLGVESGKYDLVISNVGVTEERKDLFDFATYRRGLHAFTVAADSRISRIAEAKDVAGLTLVVGSGTNQEQILLNWDQANRAAGLKPLTLQYFDDEAASLLALKSGRVDGILGPNPSAIFRATADQEVRVVGTVEAGWPDISDVGAATARGNGLAQPVHTVLQTLIDTGTLARALEPWGVAEEILPTSALNPPGLPRREK